MLGRNLSFFKAQVTSSSKCASFFSVMTHNITFDKSSTSKCKFSDLPLLALKYTKYLMSFFKLYITLQCHETQFFCNFSSKTFYALDKRSRSECKFSVFPLPTWKLTTFFISFFEPRVSFPLNFASPFSVMTHNSSEIF